MPTREIRTAHTAACCSSWPTTGPTSLELSTTNRSRGKASRNTASILAAVPDADSPEDFTRMKSRFPPMNCLSSLSATPPAARTLRTSPSSTGSSKRTWMEVPPAKSIPRSARPRAIWTHATTPRRTSTSERAKAPRRMLRKSMFVLPTNSIARRPRLRGGPSDTELLHPPKGQPVEDPPGPHGRRKQIDGHAEGERHGKASHRPAPEEKEGERGDQRGDMRIQDGHPGLAESAVDGGAHRLPEPQLFTDPLQDHDVAIHRHADGEGDAGDPGQGQGRLDPCEQAEEHEEVQQEGRIGDDPGQAVVDGHQEDHEDAGHDARLHAGPDRVLPQGGPHGQVGHHVDRRRQRARPQDDRQVAGRLGGKIPLDDAAPFADPALDDWGALD